MTQHEVRASEMYLDGATYREIAIELKISHTRVVQVMQGLRERWRRDSWKNIELLMCRELRTIDAVENEAWEAWDRSKKNAETLQTKAAPGGKKTTTKTVVGQVGDARFLQVVNDCVEKRCKILGIQRTIGDMFPEPEGPFGALVPTPAELRARIVAKLEAIPGYATPIHDVPSPHGDPPPSDN